MSYTPEEIAELLRSLQAGSGVSAREQINLALQHIVPLLQEVQRFQGLARPGRGDRVRVREGSCKGRMGEVQDFYPDTGWYEVILEDFPEGCSPRWQFQAHELEIVWPC